MQTLPPESAAEVLASRLPHGLANLTPLAQLKRMQRVLFDTTQSESVNAKVLAAVACAWERLEERKRILTMRPKPRDVDVTPKVRSASGYSRTRIRRAIAAQATVEQAAAVALALATDARIVESCGEAPSPSGDAPLATSASEAPHCDATPGTASDASAS